MFHPFQYLWQPPQSQLCDNHQPDMVENQKEQEKEDVKEKPNEKREKPKRDEERESVKQRKREEDKKIISEIPHMIFFQTFIDYTLFYNNLLALDV